MYQALIKIKDGLEQCPQVLDSRPMLKGLLHDLCPDQKLRDRMLKAYDSGVVTEMMQWSGEVSYQRCRRWAARFKIFSRLPWKVCCAVMESWLFCLDFAIPKPINLKEPLQKIGKVLLRILLWLILLMPDYYIFVFIFFLPEHFALLSESDLFRWTVAFMYGAALVFPRIAIRLYKRGDLLMKAPAGVKLAVVGAYIIVTTLSVIWISFVAMWGFSL